MALKQIDLGSAAHGLPRSNVMRRQCPDRRADAWCDSLDNGAGRRRCQCKVGSSSCEGRAHLDASRCIFIFIGGVIGGDKAFEVLTGGIGGGCWALRCIGDGYCVALAGAAHDDEDQWVGVKSSLEVAGWRLGIKTGTRA